MTELAVAVVVATVTIFIPPHDPCPDGSCDEESYYVETFPDSHAPYKEAGLLFPVKR